MSLQFGEIVQIFPPAALFSHFQDCSQPFIQKIHHKQSSRQVQKDNKKQSVGKLTMLQKDENKWDPPWLISADFEIKAFFPIWTLPKSLLITRQVVISKYVETANKDEGRRCS